MWIYVIQTYFSKSRETDETTMLVSRVPKFCARRWSQILELSYQNSKNIVKLGINEPWPECQPELFQNLFQNDADGDGGGGDGAGTTHPSWWVPREHHAQGSNIPFGYPSLWFSPHLHKTNQYFEFMDIVKCSHINYISCYFVFSVRRNKSNIHNFQALSDILKTHNNNNNQQ